MNAADRAARGRELIEALELAAMFPVRHEPMLTAPVFPRHPTPVTADLVTGALALLATIPDRTEDWADLEEMAAAGTLDAERVVGVLVRYLGADDPRVARLLSLTGSS